MMNRRELFAGLAAAGVAAGLPLKAVAAPDIYEGSSWVFDGVNDYFRINGNVVTWADFTRTLGKAAPHCEFKGKAIAYDAGEQGMFIDTRAGGGLTIKAVEPGREYNFLGEWPTVK